MPTNNLPGATFIDSATGASYTTGPGGFISGATPVAGGINPMTGAVSNMTVPTANVTRVDSNAVNKSPLDAASLYTDYNAKYNQMLAAQREALERQYQARAGQIGSSYTAGKQDIQDVGARIGGSLRRTLGRAGAFTTTAGAMAEANQTQSVQNQIGKLGAARDQALAEAMAAKETGMADAYEKAMNNMFNVQKEMINLQQQEQDRADKLREFELSRQDELKKFEYGVGQDKLDYETKLLGAGFTYVDTPAKRDALRAKGYEIFTAPNGRTYAKAPEVKTTGGGASVTDVISGLPKGFMTAAQKEIGNLQKGETWGTVWNRMKMNFPMATNEQIDTALGGSVTQAVGPTTKTGEAPKVFSGWATPGEFERWKQKQYKQTDSPQWQQQSGVWSWLASQEAASMTPEQKRQEIMANGFNPDDFGVY